MYTSVLIRAIALSSLLSVPGFARGMGGEIGGGGDSVRLDVVAVAEFIQRNCGEWKTLKAAGINCESLSAKLGMAQSHLQIDEAKVADGEVAPAVRLGDQEWIVNRQLWLEAEAETNHKVAMILHPLLVAVGGEAEASYLVTFKLLNELRMLFIAKSLDYVQPTSFTHTPVYNEVKLPDGSVRLNNVKIKVNALPSAVLVEFDLAVNLRVPSEKEAYVTKLCGFVGFKKGLDLELAMDKRVLEKQIFRPAVLLPLAGEARYAEQSLSPVTVKSLTCRDPN